MHVSNGSLRVSFIIEQDVCCAAIRIEGSVNGEVKVFDATELTKDLVEVLLIDVFG